MSWPWPRSQVYAMTSRSYVSLIHLTATDVSSPPLYARTTLSRATGVVSSGFMGKNDRLVSGSVGQGEGLFQTGEPFLAPGEVGGDVDPDLARVDQGDVD